MKTIQEKYNAVQEGRFSKSQFLKDAKRELAHFLSPFNGFNDSVSILKNKGVLLEASDKVEAPHNISPEGIKRGKDAELVAMGFDPTTCDDKETCDQAEAKALANLKKNPLHYLNIMAGESSSEDKNDQPVEVKKGNEVDKANAMQPVKEAVVQEDAEEDAKNDADYEAGWNDDPRSDEGSEQVIDPADYGVIGQNYLAGFGRENTLNLDSLEKLGRKIVAQLFKGDFKAAMAKHGGTNEAEGMYIDDDEFEEEMIIDRVKEITHLFKGYDGKILFDFVKTHRQDIRGASDEEIQDEFANFVSVNYESGSDYNEEKGVEEAMSDEEMKKVQNYGKQDSVTVYKPGAKFSTDFDYEGMLKAALEIRLSTPIETMQAIFDSMEDVNYHREASHLSMAIEAKEEKNKSEALNHLKALKVEVKKTMQEVSEGKSFVRKVVTEGRRKKTRGGKMVQESDYDTGGYVESMGPLFDKACDMLAKAFGEWADGPMTEPGMVAPAKKDVISYLDQKLTSQFLEEESSLGDIQHTVCPECDGSGCDHCDGTGGHPIDEKKGKDLDKDGDVDKDDYKKAKDIAIKKALKENVKAIIKRVLSEEVINEAATNQLAHIATTYETFPGMKQAIINLQDIVTDIESYYDKTRDKVQKVYDTLGNISNEDGLKVGGFLAPAIEQAFLKDLRPVTKSGFTKGLDQPKVRTISKSDIDKGYVANEVEEEKQTVFSAPVNGTLRETKK